MIAIADYHLPRRDATMTSGDRLPARPQTSGSLAERSFGADPVDHPAAGARAGAVAEAEVRNMDAEVAERGRSKSRIVFACPVALAVDP